MAKRDSAGPPQQVTNMVEGALAALDRHTGGHRIALARAWQEVAGDYNAERTRALRISNGVATIAVASASLHQHLHAAKDTLLAKLQARLAPIPLSDLLFVTGEVSSLGPPAPRPAPAAETALQYARPIPLPPLADPELAAAFRRIAEARDRRALAARVATKDASDGGTAARPKARKPRSGTRPSKSV